MPATDLCKTRQVVELGDLILLELNQQLAKVKIVKSQSGIDEDGVMLINEKAEVGKKTLGKTVGQQYQYNVVRGGEVASQRLAKVHAILQKFGSARGARHDQN